MLSYCNNYLATMPDITIYMNCDTRLAINLRWFDLGENDEFIFAIKNYDYINSPYVFLFRARKKDMDENGEVFFKITPATARHIKPGAFYNFTLLANAFDLRKETEYKKLTDNGNIIIEYGAQDLTVQDDFNNAGYEITNAKLELINKESSADLEETFSRFTGMRFEQVDQEEL